MKTLIKIALIAMLFSCESGSKYKYKMLIFSDYYSLSSVDCDSFQMVSTKECFIWVDGTKMRVIGNPIKPNSR